MVDLLVTYMQLTRQPVDAVPAPDIGRIGIRRECSAVADYLDLYSAVGGPVQWDQRLRMPSAELHQLLESESTVLFVLRLDTAPVGLCEFVNALGAEIELANFGLIPKAQGKGLGPHFLNVALRTVWSPATTRRIWLRTDTNDHPKALPTYERAGFRIFDRRVESFPD